MEGIEELFDFFYHQAKEIPWNLYPNFPEYFSTDLVLRIKQEWNTMPQDSQMGFLVGILTPYKRKITAEYKEDALLLLESALEPGNNSDVVLMAKCIQHWVKYGYLDLSVYKNSDAFKNIQDKLREILKDIKWVPSEVEFLSEKVLESYDLPELVKEGLVLKESSQIPCLKDRMAKYGVDHLQERESPVRGEREKKTTPSSFLRRASRGSITSPSTFPKARQSLVKDSKAVVLDLKEIESLQMEQVKEKRKLEDEKIKKQKEKEEAKEAKKLEKFRLEDEKRKHDQVKKEQDRIRKEKAEEEKKLLLQRKKENVGQKRQEDLENSKRKGSNDENGTYILVNILEAKKTKFAPSQKVFDVIGNADLCTSEDLHVIEDFLQGRYSKMIFLTL